MKKIIIIIFGVVILFCVFIYKLGYNFEYLKLIINNSCIYIDRYRLCPSKKFNLIQIYDKKTNIIYYKGFIPLFNENSINSYVMLNHANTRELIIIYFMDTANNNIKNSCINNINCSYSNINLYGRAGVSVVFKKISNTKFIQIPDLQIMIVSNLTDDSVLNEINVSILSSSHRNPHKPA